MDKDNIEIFDIDGNPIGSSDGNYNTGTNYSSKRCNSSSNTTRITRTVKTGLSFGSALAMVISYTTWQSIGWAIIHGILGWVYVIYFVFRY